MPIIFDTTLQATIERIRTDIQNALPNSNPYLQASFLNAIATGLGGRVNDFYLQALLLQTEMFPDTASLNFLPSTWGSYKGLEVLPATQASGFITATGTPGTVINSGTTYQSNLQNNAGLQYTSTAEAVIATTSITVNLISSQNLATATINGNPGWANGTSVTITGATQSAYNVTAPITIIGINPFTDEFVFTYPITGLLTSDIGLATATTASIPVTSVGFGVSQDLISGTELNLLTPIAGVINTAVVQFDGISGGTDAESLESYRTRVLASYQNPIAQFNANAIINYCKSVPGVTRVWVYPITPGVGQVSVLFTRDNDPSIIPSADDVATVKAVLVAQAPVNTGPEAIFVNNPFAGVPVNFVFTTLVPNTSTMQEAIINNLKDFFTSRTMPAISIPANAYQAAIYQTIDSTGAFVQSFSLGSPTGAINVSSGQIAILGSVVFA